MTQAEREAMRDFIVAAVKAEVARGIGSLDLSALRGAPGEKGDPGEPGTPGPAGRDGIDGKDGAPGVRGEKGMDGERGVDGRDGRDGRDGKDGIASRDELLAEVAKAVEMAVPEMVEKRVAEAFAALPVLQYRGVFRQGEEYAAGSVVTWAGSTWHANEATKDKPGDGETAWTLMVKKGRDATTRVSVAP